MFPLVLILALITMVIVITAAGLMRPVAMAADSPNPAPEP